MIPRKCVWLRALFSGLMDLNDEPHGEDDCVKDLQCAAMMNCKICSQVAGAKELAGDAGENPRIEDVCKVSYGAIAVAMMG